MYAIECACLLRKRLLTLAFCRSVSQTIAGRCSIRFVFIVAVTQVTPTVCINLKVFRQGSACKRMCVCVCVRVCVRVCVCVYVSVLCV
jgi:hypothetical protein